MSEYAGVLYYGTIDVCVFVAFVISSVSESYVSRTVS